MAGSGLKDLLCYVSGKKGIVNMFSSDDDEQWSTLEQ